MPLVAADHTDHHQQCLEHNDDQDSRDQISSIAFRIIIQGGSDHIDRLHGSQLRGIFGRKEHQHLRAETIVKRQHGRSRGLLHRQVVQECTGRFIHDKDRLVATGNAVGKVVWQVEDTGRLVHFHQLFSLYVILARSDHIYLRRGIEQADIFAAQGCFGIIDNNDRDVTNQVGGIHIII